MIGQSLEGYWHEQYWLLTGTNCVSVRGPSVGLPQLAWLLLTRECLSTAVVGWPSAGEVSLAWYPLQGADGHIGPQPRILCIGEGGEWLQKYAPSVRSLCRLYSCSTWSAEHQTSPGLTSAKSLLVLVFGPEVSLGDQTVTASTVCWRSCHFVFVLSVPAALTEYVYLQSR